ncbi:autotransporter-associated beta strand repeat-containing protein [Luteolibacter sp. LG18]|uniref:autotransporter-associated beta strand repeat-containing protein n=1 Tax=Luteolibacter sp. LG18 TaxID=2819286 RepID=UPI002B2A3788|nr:hypothetical protein llg_28130 [Luteolibacter sp. LG18]
MNPLAIQKPRLSFRAPLPVTCSLPLLLALGTVNAADWTGATDSNWSTPGNWTGGSVPGATVNAVVNTSTGNIATISADVTDTPTEIVIGGWFNTGRVDHTAGTLGTVHAGWPLGWLLVGFGVNGNGTYNLANTATTGGTLTGYGTGSGTLNITDAVFLGEPFGDNTQAGTSTLNINTTGALNITFGLNGAPNLYQSTVNLDAGTVNIGQELWVARNGTGVFNQSGGTVNSTGWLVLSRYNTATSTYNLTGGTVNAATSYGNVPLVSEGGSGTLNVSGGLFNTPAALWVAEGYGGSGTGTLNLSGSGVVKVGNTTDGVRMAVNGGTNGIVNLNGGTLETPVVTNGNGTGTFNFNGGTLKGTQTRSDFVAGISHTWVKAGGAVIDSAGFNLVIPQALLTDTVSTGGGLTKTGAGDLALTGANTYTGETKVLAGSLTLSSAFLADASTVRISGGATLALTHGATDVIRKLYVNGTQLAAGLYRSADGSGDGTVLAELSGTGKLQVTTNPVSEAYETWIASYFPGQTNPAVVDVTADPDGDGKTNLNEFAFDDSPASATTAGKMVGKTAMVDGEQSYVLVLPVRDGATFSGSAEQTSSTVDGIRYRIEGSMDLAAWNLSVVEVLGADKAAAEASMPALHSGWSYRSFSIGAPLAFSSRAFLRAVAIQQP